MLNEGAAKLDSNVANASDTLGGQAALVLGNLGEFTRLLHRLDDVAPPEIAADMSETVKAWDAQRDAMKDVANDPLKALTSQVVTAVFSSASVQAVEDYAVKTCGRPLFGSIGAAGPARCPTMGSAGPSGGGTASFASTLSSDAKVASLLDALKSMASLHADVRKVSDPFLQQIEALKPEARFALEAIGRLNFGGRNASGALDAIDKAVSTVCGRPAFGPERVAATRDLLPRPESSGVKVSSSMYGTPCAGGGGMLSSGIEPGVPFVQLFRCKGGMYAVMDLGSGTPTWLQAPDGEPVNKVENAGDRLVWIDKRERPAQGLEPVRSSVALRIMPFDGSPVITVPILTDHLQPLGETRYEVVSAWRDRVVTYEGRPGQKGTDLVVRDGSGKDVARVDLTAENIYDDSAPKPAAADTLLVLVGRDSKSVLLDVYSGRLIRSGTRVRTVKQTVCVDRALVEAEGGPGWQVTVADGKPLMTPLAPGFDERRSFSLGAAVARAGVIVDRDAAGNLRARRPDGNVAWTIGSEVAKSWSVLGGWIEVENRSGQKIIVDPTTGREATGLSSTVTSAVAKLSGEPPDVSLVDSKSNTLIIVREGQANRFPLDEVCPP